jgi:dTDP-4-amino-4,6-dideoxygalactose transaminase
MAQPLPCIDLKTQYATLKDDIAARIQAVLDHGQYILGPEEVAELEQRPAAYTGAAHYPVLQHQQQAYRDISRVVGSLDHAMTVASRVVSLPMHPHLDAATQARIVGALAEALEAVA